MTDDEPEGPLEPYVVYVEMKIASVGRSHLDARESTKKHIEEKILLPSTIKVVDSRLAKPESE